MAILIDGIGPTARRTFTFPDANATILTTNAAVTAVQGGTGLASYTTGDLLYASGVTTLAKLGIGAAGTVLVGGAAPSWSASPSLTTLTLSTALAVGTNPATTGGIRLANNVYVVGRNGANSGDINLIAANTVNDVIVGDTNAANHITLSIASGGLLTFNGITASFPALKRSGTALEVKLADDSAYTQLNTGNVIGQGTVQIAGFDNVQATTYVLSGSGSAPSSGAVRLPNGQSISSVTTGVVTRPILKMNASDQVEIGDGGIPVFLDGSDIKWGKALVALGGGAAPTLGTIGGSGPATAAQNTWLRVLDSTGAAAWIPVWK